MRSERVTLRVHRARCWPVGASWLVKTSQGALLRTYRRHDLDSLRLLPPRSGARRLHQCKLGNLQMACVVLLGFRWCQFVSFTCAPWWLATEAQKLTIPSVASHPRHEDVSLPPKVWVTHCRDNQFGADANSNHGQTTRCRWHDARDDSLHSSHTVVRGAMASHRRPRGMYGHDISTDFLTATKGPADLSRITDLLFEVC